MRHMLLAMLLAASAVVAGTLALAQNVGHNQHSAADSRELVALPTPMVDHMLGNMRDHLLALQEMQEALSKAEFDRVAGIAEQRLGLSSMQLHGAHEMSKFMPKGMQDVGSGMHRAASRLAVSAQDAGVSGDVKPVLSALSAVTAQCVGCHAGYRVR